MENAKRACMLREIQPMRGQSVTQKKNLNGRFVFVWENFGPMHADRLDSVARNAPKSKIYGVEIYDKSESYSWASEARESFEKITLVAKDAKSGAFMRLRKLLGARRKIGKASWFLCHYERPEIFLFAIWLRLTGNRVFTMGCSKFDDQPRRAWREAMKWLFFSPYHGAIGSNFRSTAYFSFHGFSDSSLSAPYNTLSIRRMREQAGVESIHEVPCEFGERNWVIVARLVEKKNLEMALAAFATYVEFGGVRRVRLLGDGPLENALKERANSLGIADRVDFVGVRAI